MAVNEILIKLNEWRKETYIQSNPEWIVFGRYSFSVLSHPPLSPTQTHITPCTTSTFQGNPTSKTVYLLEVLFIKYVTRLPQICLHISVISDIRGNHQALLIAT